MEHYTLGYIPPLGVNSNPHLGLKEQEIIFGRVIGAGAKNVFDKRFGEGYLNGLEGIAKNTLAMLLEYQGIQKTILFPESRVNNIKSDAHIGLIRELETKEVGIILQYGRPVGIKI